MEKKLPTVIDRMTPDFRKEVKNRILRQKQYHDLKMKLRELLPEQEIWVKNKIGKGWRPRVVEEKTRNLYSLVRP